MVTKGGKQSKTKERWDKGDIAQSSKGGISREIPRKLGHLLYALYETNNPAKGHSKKKNHCQWIFSLTLSCQFHRPRQGLLCTPLFSQCARGAHSQCNLNECMHVRESGILKIFSGILNCSLATSWNEKTKSPEFSSTNVSLVNIHALKIFVDIRLTILLTQHSK